jgi:hypothetical protein
MADAILSSAKAGKSFYVYLHRRATDGTVFYVGKGTNGRATAHSSRNLHWRNIVAKHGLVVEYVAVDVLEWYALERERELIAYYGRENLCNLTDGGDGVTGMRQGEAARRAIGLASRGKKRPRDLVERIAAKQRGRVVSEEQRRAISAKLKGRKVPAEVARKAGLTHLGKKRSEATRERMRLSWADPVRRAERGAAMSTASGHARRVRCVETGQLFLQMKHADNWLREIGKLSGKQSRISTACRDRTKTAGGFHWELADDRPS